LSFFSEGGSVFVYHWFVQVFSVFQEFGTGLGMDSCTIVVWFYI